MTVFEYDFGRLIVEGNIITGEMREGEDIGVDVMQETFRLAEELYGEAPWGYISNRANSYSLQPVVYVHIQQLESHNLVAYAAVIPNYKSQIYNDTEKMLVDDQFEYAVFNTVEEAEAWVKARLNS